MSLGTSDTKFSAALGNDKRISVAGAVKGFPVLLMFPATLRPDYVHCALQEVLESLKVSLGTSDTKFSAALGNDKRISVAGAVKGFPVLLMFPATLRPDYVHCALQEVLESLKVSLGTSDTKFSAALGNDKRISVAGAVKQSYLTRSHL